MPKAPRVKTCVFSRTIDRIDDEGAELVKDDVVDFVRELKQQFGRKICLMGGGELGRFWAQN